jgi:hypothetical protein
MNRFIVCTTINEPTEAIRRFDAMTDWTLIVVGDRRTPSHYPLENGIYLSPDEQMKLAPRLSDAIGWDKIQRRNMGFVLARKLGAELIATVDDDNEPYEHWGRSVLVGKMVSVSEYRSSELAFDPLSVTNQGHLWHRGFPLQLLSNRDNHQRHETVITPMIQADLWDGDPDIDAICRMEHAPDVDFDPTPFPFTSNRLSPFNSQNTFIHNEILADYFMFPFVGRMDDIWASYYVQAVGHRVIYERPSVRQRRNPHDLTADFRAECDGYLKNHLLVQDLYESPNAIRQYLPSQALQAWDEYRRTLDAI